MKFNLFFTFLLLSFSSIYSQNSILQTTQVVVPNVNASVNGGNIFLGPYVNTQITYQLLIAESQLTNLAGKNLVSISFRNSLNTPQSWPSSDATFLNYDIYLGQSVSPINRTLVFGLNAIGLPTQVRSGNLIIQQNALSVGSNPNSFSYDIPFQTPYYYSGGNLLVEIRHYGSSSPSNRVDSVSTTDAGYGTLFSASWYPSNTTSINNAIEDNFSVINFKAEDVLSVENLEKSKTIIYPNPAFNYLVIESNNKVLNVKIYNLIGQLLVTKELNNKHNTIDVSQITDGTYLLFIEDEFGTEMKKIIKN